MFGATHPIWRRGERRSIDSGLHQSGLLPLHRSERIPPASQRSFRNTLSSLQPVYYHCKKFYSRRSKSALHVRGPTLWKYLIVGCVRSALKIEREAAREISQLTIPGAVQFTNIEKGWWTEADSSDSVPEERHRDKNDRSAKSRRLLTSGSTTLSVRLS